MADNVAVRPSTDTSKIDVATDEISSVHYPIYKTAYGADGSVTQVDAANPLPVNVADTITKNGKTSLYTVAGISDTQTAHISLSTSSTLIAYMLIDISNTSAWKHTNTGEIIIEYINIQIDPTANFLGDIKIGFIEDVNATNGHFHQIFDVNMKRKSDLFFEGIDFGTHGLHCQDASHFGPTETSALFQTDLNLGGPDDPTTLAYPSGENDLVMIVDGDGTNLVDVSITIGYETVA